MTDTPASSRTAPATPRAAPAAVPFLLESTGPLDLERLFGSDRPVELEIGCGKGLFLVTAATLEPGRNFLGIEVARKYARFTADRLARRGLTNARVVRGDARALLRDAVPDASVAVLHVYFPDPWWKRRHKKRRVFSEEFVRQAARVLVPGGELRFATDVAEYFGVMRALVSAHPAFLPLEPPAEKPPEHDLDYLTNFERKYRQGGRPILRAQFQKTRQPAPHGAGPPDAR